MWITPRNNRIHSTCPYYIKSLETRRFRSLTYHPPTDLLIKPHTRVSSYIRFANFSPYAPKIDIYLDHRVIAKNVNFAEQTMYITVAPKEYTVSIYRSDEPNEVLYETTIDIPEESVISTISINLINGVDLISVDDDARILPDEVFIKFANVSPGSPPLDFIVNLNDYFTNTHFNYISNYEVLEKAPNYNVIIRRSDTHEVIYNVPNILLKTGNAYTFYAIGILDGEPPFTFVTSLDGSSYFVD
ncbi:uncharacterized protein DUF4397 [Natranaerovirga pectinivora]|uniref:Uncharacterized protein DUF4397 n=1 Tax=Natranaerovirga pectinivora TaxID=682400 RepID=A0A4R3MIC6_9FIRM|nr:DUF4397 domain-containing protein [Natranaerovirga pectinivora]TCT12129.1 uncharacterized protein DUF4397 [Natranaerovirga pectinivora]